MIKKLNIKKIILIILLIPFLFIAQYYLFKCGFISPQIKGLNVKVVEGQYIKDLDKYVIKLNQDIILSTGDYIKFPTYAKTPVVEFKNLNDDNIVEISDNSQNIKNTVKVSALKKGMASIAVVKDGRILKKFNILVVNPKVTDLNTDIEGDLDYVGDSAIITNSVEVDFDRFNDKYDVKYKTSNPDVLKIKENKVYAVGVGNATITALLKSKEESFSYNIVAKIKNIKLDSDIHLEVGEKKHINTEVITSPKNLKTPKVKYKFAQSKLPVDRKIRLDQNGDIVGLRKGTEKLIVSCGSGKNKVEKYVYVTVEEVSIKDKAIKDFYLNYYFIDKELVLDLRWNNVIGATKYEIYIKNANEDNSYKKIKTIDNKDSQMESNVIEQTLKLEYDDTKNIDYYVYVVGINKNEQTSKSKIYNIKNNNILDENAGEEGESEEDDIIDDTQNKNE